LALFLNSKKAVSQTNYLNAWQKQIDIDRS